MTISIATFLSCVGGLLAFFVAIYVMRIFKIIDRYGKDIQELKESNIELKIQNKIISNGSKPEIDKMVHDSIKRYKEGK